MKCAKRSVRDVYKRQDIHRAGQFRGIGLGIRARQERAHRMAQDDMRCAGKRLFGNLMHFVQIGHNVAPAVRFTKIAVYAILLHAVAMAGMVAANDGIAMGVEKGGEGGVTFDIFLHAV